MIAPSRARVVPLPHGIDAALLLQRGGDTVERLESAARQVLPMRVEIDEPRSDDMAAGVDGLSRPAQRRLGDRDDLPAADADVPHSVEPRLRVYDAPPANDDVVLGLRCGGDGDRNGCPARGEQREAGNDERAHGASVSRHAASRNARSLQHIAVVSVRMGAGRFPEPTCLPATGAT